MSSGIYILTSPSGKSYIGQSFNLKKRIGEYKRLECKGQIKIYRAILKHGFENFKVEYLFKTNNNFKYLKILLDSLEIHFIKQYNTLNNGYNIQLGGSNGKHSEETKEKLRVLHTGKKLSEETKRKIGEKSKNKKISDRQKKILSDKFKGKPLSEEHKLKLKISRNKRITSDETKLKMSKSQTGRIHSEETKLKMRESAIKRKNMQNGKYNNCM
jgi:group I intron endonuclease